MHIVGPFMTADSVFNTIGTIPVFASPNGMTVLGTSWRSWKYETLIGTLNYSGYLVRNNSKEPERAKLAELAP